MNVRVRVDYRYDNRSHRWSWSLFYGNMKLISQSGFESEKIARQSFEMIQRCVAYLRGENGTVQ